MRKDLDLARQEHDAKKAEHRAERAEQDAADTIDFALYALEEAERACIDAAIARADADDAAMAKH